MAIERSHGRARPTLPRARELQLVAAAPDRADVRTRDGRFGKGNAGGKDRGWKRAIVAMLARDADDLTDAAASVARSAWHLYTASLKDLPARESPIVRSLAARRARHEALESYWSAQAIAHLGTPEGVAAEDRANAHGQAATRLAVVLLDVASRLAAARPALMPPWHAPTVPDQDDRDEVDARGEQAAQDGPGGDDEGEDGPEAVDEDGRGPAAPTRPGAHVATIVASAGLCRHNANPRMCPTCFNAAREGQPHAVPWRQALPRSHPQYRGPR